MKPAILYLVLACLFGAVAACSKGGAPESTDAAHADGAGHYDEVTGEHGDEHGHDDDHGEPDFARIDPASAAQHGIKVTQAAAGPVPESISLTGRLIIDPRRVALVRARFLGPVRRIGKDVGESVRKDDVLAQVESNDSLTLYDVKSPITGVVLERMTNVGDVAGTDPLFRIGDLSSLQAELKVFQNDQRRIQRGAQTSVRVGDQDVKGKIVSILPEIDSRTQAMLVRVDLSVDGPLDAAPGQFVAGQVIVGQGDAAIAIVADAVQRLAGREVVFVQEAEGFRARPVTVGRRSRDYVEITNGLASGEPYVSSGAFLVKAELGKHLAAHED